MWEVKKTGFMPNESPFCKAPQKSVFDLDELVNELPFFTPGNSNPATAYGYASRSSLRWSDPHLEYAFLTLCGYVAKYNRAGLIVPSQFLRVIGELSKKLTRNPLMSYTSYILCNWSLIIEGDGVAYDNILPILFFTRPSSLARHTEWKYISLHVTLEAASVKAVKFANDMKYCAADYHVVIQHLLNTVDHMIEILAKFNDYDSSLFNKEVAVFFERPEPQLYNQKGEGKWENAIPFSAMQSPTYWLFEWATSKTSDGKDILSSPLAAPIMESMPISHSLFFRRIDKIASPYSYAISSKYEEMKRMAKVVRNRWTEYKRLYAELVF